LNGSWMSTELMAWRLAYVSSILSHVHISREGSRHIS
jgi:hypothetical protein